jgi:hypothetical protein
MPNRNIYTEVQLSNLFENLRQGEIRLAEDTLREIDKLKATGKSAVDVAHIMVNKAEKDGFGKEFLNDAAHDVWQTIKEVSQNNLYNSLPMANLYQWQYNPGAKHCEVCAKLNGQIKTLEEWKAEGLPGHRNEGCYYNCCCDLVRIKTARTRDIREKNEYGIPKNYEHDYAGRIDKEFEHIKTGKYDKDENGNDVKDKWGNSMKGVTIEGIDTLNDKLGYNSEVMKGVKRNYQEQAYVALKYVQATVGKEALKNLKEINVVDIKGGGYGAFGKIKGKGVLYIGQEYFAKKEKGKDGFLRGADSYFVREKEFSDTIVHELSHYLVWNYGMKESKKIYEFYNRNVAYLSKRFGTLKEYAKAVKPEETLVRAIAQHYTGELYKNDKNANEYSKEHEATIKFVKEMLKIFKEKEAILETGRGR